MITLNDFDKQAKNILPKVFYDYYASGACDEISLKNNRQAYDNIHLAPRVLRDVSKRNLSIKLLDYEISMPILIAPTSFHGMATTKAEKATACAAKSVGTIMIASTMSNTSLEDISLEYPDGLWFQLYVLNDKTATLELIKRAENSCYRALVLTVDSQILGVREKDLQNNYSLPSHLSIGNLIENKNFQKKSLLTITATSQELFDKQLTWKDIEWLRKNTKLPIFLKGILHKSDAKTALEHGIDGIIISNHGGRQLDTSMPPIYALPEISNIISGKIPLLIDGGIRRGTDVVKAIALGADAVLIGRPIIWGLAVNGAEGAIQVLNILKYEFDVAMALCGFSSVTELKKQGKSIIYNLK